MGTFSWEAWESLLGNFGALYLATWDPVLGNLLGPSGICTWGPSLGSLYSELLWEPAQSNFGNLGSPVEPLLGNLVGTSTMGTLGTLYEPVLGNLYLGTLETFTWEPLLGNFAGTFTWAPWKPLFETCWGLVGTCAWPPLLGNLRNLHLGTLETFTWEPLLRNVGTCTV